MPSSGSTSAISFRDRSAEAKVAQAGGQNVGWGGVFLDADNDGWVDLFRANGNDHHLFGEQSLVLRNRGDGTFEDVSRAAGDAFLRKVVGRSAAVADLWNDGRLSVVMQTVDGGPVLLRGRGAEPGHWLGLDLHGTAASPSGPRTLRPSVGARVKVVAASGAQVDEVRAGSGYLSCSDPRLHFGLGKDASAVRLEIRWPSGDVQTIENVAVDQMLRVDEPQRADGQAR